MTATALSNNPNQNNYSVAQQPTDQTNSFRNTLRAVPESSEARGFALYIGLSEQQAAEQGTSLQEIVAALRNTLAELAPKAQTHAVVALAPSTAGGNDVEVVRKALQDASSSARANEIANKSPKKLGVTVDISRRQILLDQVPSKLSYLEFQILKYLVIREGQNISREELINGLWAENSEDRPNTRTIDVHIRRLRVKLGEYGNILQTVRNQGYRFDRHSDVTIITIPGPSPDAF